MGVRRSPRGVRQRPAGLAADEFGWRAVPMIGLLAYFLIGTDFTAEDVEDPFGHDGDDLTLAAYCDTIRRSVAETLGE